MGSAISCDYLPRSEERSAGRPHSAIIEAATAGPSDERSGGVLFESRMAEQWRRAWRVIAAEFVCEISGYDVRRYLTEDADPSTARN